MANAKNDNKNIFYFRYTSLSQTTSLVPAKRARSEEDHDTQDDDRTESTYDEDEDENEYDNTLHGRALMLRDNLERLQNDLASSRKDVNQLIEDIKQSQEQIEQARKDAKREDDIKDSLRTQLRTSKAEAESMKAKVAKLEAGRIVDQQFSSMLQQQVARQTLELAEKNENKSAKALTALQRELMKKQTRWNTQENKHVKEKRKWSDERTKHWEKEEKWIVEKGRMQSEKIELDKTIVKLQLKLEKVSREKK